MAKSLTEQLEEVEAAITRTLEAQRYSVGNNGRAKDNPQLATLFAERSRLQDAVNSSGLGDSMASLAQMEMPR